MPLADPALRPRLDMQRTFEAPRALVWRAWTQPEAMVLWMGPVEYPAFSVTLDFRVGGRWRIGLKSPETGDELWQGGVYEEIVEPERIAFTFKWEGDNHEDGPPVDTRVTVRLTSPGRTVPRRASMLARAASAMRAAFSPARLATARVTAGWASPGRTSGAAMAGPGTKRT